MNICVLYYDGFCESEIVLSLWGKIVKENNVFAAATEDKVYISEEHQKFVADRIVYDLDPDEVDMLIVPGGEPAYLYGDEKLRRFFQELDKRGKIIAGICGGNEIMGEFDILRNRKWAGGTEGLSEEFIKTMKGGEMLLQDVVVDDNIITADGQGFIEFAVEVKRKAGVYKNDKEAEASYRWMKNIK